MYLYLYDHFLNDSKFHKTLVKIETRLTDLGIGGKISRLSPLKNIKELINDEVRFGVKTIVAVGGDQTVSLVINNIAKCEDIVFGIIPIGKNNCIAQALGIPHEEEACDVLSARKLEKIDLGKVNNTYFISNIHIAAESRVTLECEESYQITPETNIVSISICNLRPAALEGIQDARFFNPRDGFLEALVEPIQEISKSLFNIFKKKNTDIHNSIFPFKKISVLTKKAVTVTTDGRKVLKPPICIEVVPKKLTVVVGRNRAF